MVQLLLMPNAINKFIFESAKTPEIDDRKKHCINLILSCLQSSICRQFSRWPNMNLFVPFSITLFLSICFSELHSEITWTTPPITISSPGISASEASLGIDDLGNTTVIWLEDSYVKSSAFLKGTGWSFPPETISNQGSSTPRIVVDARRNATAVWNENGIIKSAQRPFKGKWSSPTALSNQGASSPEIAIDGTGNIVAVWIGVEQTIQSSTKFVDKPWPLIPDTISDAGADAPQIAIGNDGTVVAIWHQINSSINTIYSSKKTLQNDSWSQPLAISNSKYNSHYPKVIVDSNGNATAIWYRFNLRESIYSNVALQSSYFPINGNWSNSTDVSSLGFRDPAELNSHLTLDGDGNVAAIWTMSFDDATYYVQFAIKPFNGIWTTPANLVGQNLYAFDSGLCGNAKGNIFFIYMLYNARTSSLNIQASDCIINTQNQSWALPDIISEGTRNAYPKITSSFNEAGTTSLTALWLHYNGANNAVCAITGEDISIQPPRNLSLEQKVNDLIFFQERYNVLTWSPSLSPKIKQYAVYRNGIFLDSVDASTLQIIDHNRKEHETGEYGIVAIDDQGMQSPIATIDFLP